MDLNSVEELLSQLTTQREPSEEELNETMTRAVLGLLRHGDRDAKIRNDYFGLYSSEEIFTVIRNRFSKLSWRAFSERFNTIIQSLIESEKVEIRSNKIRALYGHSIRGIIVGEMKWPEVKLFHATRGLLVSKILTEGLRPQGRTWVHLTSQLEYANRILKHHSFGGRGVLLIINPQRLEGDNVTFRQPNSHIWLATAISPAAIRVSEPNMHSGPDL